MTNSFPRSIDFKIESAALTWPKKADERGIIRVILQGGGLSETKGFDLPVSVQQAVEEILRAHLAGGDQPTPAPVEAPRTGSVATGERYTGLGPLDTGGG